MNGRLLSRCCLMVVFLLGAGASAGTVLAEDATASSVSESAGADLASRSIGSLDWAVIVLYMLGMLGVGAYYSWKVETSDDYLLGGRNMKPWAVGLSLFATLLSTITYLSLPGEVIKHGPMMLCSLLAYPFIAVAVGWLLIPHFMQLKVTSAYEVLEVRLGLKVRLVGAGLFLLLRLLWMAVIIYATVSSVLIPLMGLSEAMTPWLCAILCLITIIYTSMGGLRAVVFTDAVQTAILFGGVLLTLGMISVDMGGVSQWWPDRWDPNWQEPAIGYDPNQRVTLLGAMIATFTMFLCMAGSDQMAIQRYLATRDVSAARRMYVVSLVAGGVVQILLAFLGVALLSYYKVHPEYLLDGQTITSDADLLFPQFISIGLPSGISGLVVAGLLAAAMSSLSSGLNSSCSVVAIDFINRFRNDVNPQDHVQQFRVISIVLGVIVVLISSVVGSIEGNMLEIAYKVVNLLVAPLFGLFVMALFVPWANSIGTIVGAVAGVATACLINYWPEITGTPGISFLWAMPLSLLVQTMVGMAVSAIGPKPT
ncbi:sodium/solute symporter [Bremerella sp. JC770]|uniref:sodium:solute symporter family transporter n=1 Tax=Bremerella sp. JC770 TaxID=3232137 RepID=UPI00345A9770